MLYFLSILLMQSFDMFFLSYGNWGVLALRLAIAAIFLYHGPKKLGDLRSFMGFIGICETLGGLALLFGFLTQLASLGLGIIMFGAIYKKTREWHIPFSAMDKMGWEFDLAILGACLALLTLGAGSISVDQMMAG